MAHATLTALCAGSAIRLGALTLVPVERSRVSVTCVHGRLIADARKDVAAIVIVSPDGARALDPSGGRVDLGALVAGTRGLREAMPP